MCLWIFHTIKERNPIEGKQANRVSEKRLLLSLLNCHVVTHKCSTHAIIEHTYIPFPFCFVMRECILYILKVHEWSKHPNRLEMHDVDTQWQRKWKEWMMEEKWTKSTSILREHTISTQFFLLLSLSLFVSSCPFLRKRFWNNFWCSRYFDYYGRYTL